MVGYFFMTYIGIGNGSTDIESVYITWQVHVSSIPVSETATGTDAVKDSYQMKMSIQFLRQVAQTLNLIMNQIHKLIWFDSRSILRLRAAGDNIQSWRGYTS